MVRFIFMSLLFLSLTSCFVEDREQSIRQPPVSYIDPLPSRVSDGKNQLAELIQFSSSVKESEKKIILADLEYFDALGFELDEHRSIDLSKTLGNEIKSASALRLWLHQRLSYIVGLDLDNLSIGMVSSRQRKILWGPLKPYYGEASDNVLASNLSAEIYGFFKTQSEISSRFDYLKLKIDDEEIAVTTPRIGIMRIGPGFFDKNLLPSPIANSTANTIMRISVLFHEARHSDGNSAAKSSGMPHVVCPMTSNVASELRGTAACDRSSNGAYAVGAEVLKVLIAQCGTNCSTKTTVILQAIYLDYLSRIIGRDVLSDQPDSEIREIDTLNFVDGSIDPL
ncbi:MAG: hypothetical protein EOP04_02075 [Proteobacteria bacterium]|nr:MAG: hypothetical protein EOP04_02075 [Pseudomonadota bacterium]